MKTKILLLEDNKTIREGIKTYLEKFSYQVETAGKIKDVEETFLRAYDLFILDINLPDGLAYRLVKNIKEVDKPLIFLTVRDGDEDMIQGLRMGGDDYITKPFKLPILKARVESVLRRYAGQEESCMIFETMLLDQEATCLYIEGQKLDLSYKEYQLIEAFLKNIGRTLTRDYLMENFWENFGDDVSDNTLSVTINRLRGKLGDYSRNLKTVRGLGYRFDYEK